MKTTLLILLLCLTAGMFAMTAFTVTTTNSTLDNVIPVAALTAPTGGQTWYAGQTYAITWTATDTNLGANPIRLDYSLDGGSNYALIVNATANDGSYDLQIPDISSTTARVRITATDSFGISGQSSSASDVTLVLNQNVIVTSGNIGFAAIFADGTDTGFTTPHLFVLPEGTSVTYTVTRTDYTWDLAAGSDSNVITNLVGAKNIAFTGTYSHADQGFTYYGDPDIPIAGIAGTIADISVTLPPLTPPEAIVMIFTAAATSNLTVAVPTGASWYVVAYYNDPTDGGLAWHHGIPYPAIGPWNVLFANVPFGAKGEVPVIIDNADGTLPVELSSFTAIATENHFVQLDWVTQTESGVSGYYIYRNTENSLDAAEVVSPFVSACNTSYEQSYRYTDDEVTPGTWYYWLQNIDMNGQVAFHGSISVNLSDNNGDNGTPLIPTLTALNGVYPNPFNPITTIAFGLAKTEQVTLNIFNVRGEKVRTVVSGNLSGGIYRMTWNGVNDNGTALTSGIYFLRMTAGKYTSTAKLVLLK